jgi:hypothetical protein
MNLAWNANSFQGTLEKQNASILYSTDPDSNIIISTPDLPKANTSMISTDRGISMNFNEEHKKAALSIRRN